jgi:hypothetical protein
MNTEKPICSLYDQEPENKLLFNNKYGPLQNLIGLTSPFYSLQTILINIFNQKQISGSNINLNIKEINILRIILQKKGFPIKEKSLDNVLNLNKLSMYPLEKRKDYNVKFILARTIEHLRKKFFDTFDVYQYKQPDNIQNILQFKDYCFYIHYFGNISEKENIPIESFYIFKNHTHHYNSNIPKTITTKLINLWRKNLNFIKLINNYLNNFFLDEFKSFNELKIKKLILKWYKWVKKQGLEQGTEKIFKSLRSKGCKLPWTVSEVKYAIQETFEILNN